MLTNEQNSKPIQLSQYNNVNIPNLLDNLANNSYLRYEQEGNEYGKKYIQHVKDKLINKNGKFTKILIHKLYSKKIVSYLSDSIDSNVECNYDVKDYLINNTDILDQKLKLEYPIPFIINENNEYLFLIKNKDTPCALHT